MGKMQEIGVPIERDTPDPAYTGPDYYLIGQLRGDERPPPDIDRRGPLHPSRLWQVMAGPGPMESSVSFGIPEEGATSVEVVETVRWPRSTKPATTSDLRTVAKTALWSVPAALVGGAALGYWLGRRKKA